MRLILHERSPALSKIAAKTSFNSDRAFDIKLSDGSSLIAKQKSNLREGANKYFYMPKLKVLVIA